MIYLDIISGVVFLYVWSVQVVKMLNIVLINPEIPQNTGNIARSVIAQKCKLHLVNPLGFSLDDRNLKRAGLDYWKYLDLKVWNSLKEFFDSVDIKRIHLFSTRGEQRYDKAIYNNGDYLVFGSESSGLSPDLLFSCRERTRYLPMPNLKVRSLNLSSAVSAVFFEALRQLDFFGEV
jgi:tRNA (cytidine/uridine-2'-O-)-methyltransferase